MSDERYWFIVFEVPEYNGYAPSVYCVATAAHAAEQYRRENANSETGRGTYALAVSLLADHEWFGELPSGWPAGAKCVLRPPGFKPDRTSRAEGGR
jgi:hypothetical protein